MALGITKVNGTLLSAAPIAAAGKSWGTALNAAAGEIYDSLRVQVSITFDAAATGSVQILRRKSADDGTTVNNLGLGVLSIDAPGSAVAQKQTVELTGGDYIEIGVKNNSSAQITATVKYEGTKVTGLS